MRKFMVKSFLVVLLTAVASVSFAAGWPHSGNTRKPGTLVICTNYKSPRLLADTIRALSKQPWLLFPAAETGDQRVFFMPGKGVARELRPADVKDFVKFLNPDRIVILGNENVVPQKYVRDLHRNIPVFRVDCNDWLKVGDQLEFMLNISGLGREYRKVYADLYSDNYRMTSLPAAKPAATQEAVAEETAPAAEETETAGETAPVAEAVAPAEAAE